MIEIQQTLFNFFYSFRLIAISQQVSEGEAYEIDDNLKTRDSLQKQTLNYLSTQGKKQSTMRVNKDQTPSKPPIQSSGITVIYKTPDQKKNEPRGSSQTNKTSEPNLFQQNTNLFHHQMAPWLSSVETNSSIFSQLSSQSMFSAQPRDQPLNRRNILMKEPQKRELANSPLTSAGKSPQHYISRYNPSSEKIEKSIQNNQQMTKAFTGFINSITKGSQAQQQQQPKSQTKNPFIIARPSANVLKPKPEEPYQCPPFFLAGGPTGNQPQPRPSHLVDFTKKINLSNPTFQKQPQMRMARPPEKNPPICENWQNPRPIISLPPRNNPQIQPLPQAVQPLPQTVQPLPQVVQPVQQVANLPLIRSGLPCEVQQLLLLNHYSQYFQQIEDPELQPLHNLLSALTYKDQKRVEQKCKDQSKLEQNEVEKDNNLVATEIETLSLRENPFPKSIDILDEEETVEEFIDKLKSAFMKSYEDISSLCDSTLFFIRSDITTMKQLNSKFEGLQKGLKKNRINLDVFDEMEKKQDRIQNSLDMIDKKLFYNNKKQSELAQLINSYEDSCQLVDDAVRMTTSLDVLDREQKDELQMLNSFYVLLEGIQSTILDMNDELDKIMANVEVEQPPARKRTRSDVEEDSTIPSGKRIVWHHQS